MPAGRGKVVSVGESDAAAQHTRLDVPSSPPKPVHGPLNFHVVWLL